MKNKWMIVAVFLGSLAVAGCATRVDTQGRTTVVEQDVIVAGDEAIQPATAPATVTPAPEVANPETRIEIRGTTTVTEKEPLVAPDKELSQPSRKP